MHLRDQTEVALDRDQREAVVNTVMNIWVPQNADISQANISLSSTTPALSTVLPNIINP